MQTRPAIKLANTTGLGPEQIRDLSIKLHSSNTKPHVFVQRAQRVIALTPVEIAGDPVAALTAHRAIITRAAQTPEPVSPPSKPSKAKKGRTRPQPTHHDLGDKAWKNLPKIIDALATVPDSERARARAILNGLHHVGQLLGKRPLEIPAHLSPRA